MTLDIANSDANRCRPGIKDAVDNPRRIVLFLGREKNQTNVLKVLDDVMYVRGRRLRP